MNQVSAPNISGVRDTIFFKAWRIGIERREPLDGPALDAIVDAPLDLPLTVPGSPEQASIGAVGAAVVATDG